MPSSRLNSSPAVLAAMRNQLRTMVAALNATPYTQLRAADYRGWAYDRLTAQLAEAADHSVAGGPYQGMKYFGPAGIPTVDRIPTTKLLGSFEEELHPWVESLVNTGFRTIVHLGSGEGYHVVGMALRLASARSVVFDTLISARKACRVLADQNKVRDRMQLRSFCGWDALVDVELAGSLVFSDCGGAELILLDPVLYPSLLMATMLVETHDAFDVRITPRLISRFSPTHQIDFVQVAGRDPGKYHLLSGLPLPSAEMALEENRQVSKSGKPQTWALLTPYAS